MSIGKFFILAILLPVATIYLTLALKGHNENITEGANEEYQTYIESEESKSIGYVETPEESEFSLKDDFIESRKPSVDDSSPDSIESIISAKKYNYSNSVESEDGENTDKKEQKQSLKSNKVSSNKSKAVTVIGVQNVETEKIIKKSTTKNVFTSKKVVTKNKKITKKTKSIPKKKRVVTSKRTTKVKKPQVAKNNSPGNVKSKKKVITNPDTTKKIVFKKQTNLQKQQKSRLEQNQASTTSNIKHFGDLFDDGSGNEDEIEDEDVVLEDDNKNIEEKTETQERFTSNPCTGRSAKYIARCRKSR